MPDVRVGGVPEVVSAACRQPTQQPRAATTRPGTCWSWRVWRRSASGRRCTSAPPTPAGLMHCLWEIIDNAVDEALGGFGTEILVTLRADGGISVARPRPRHPGRHRAADRPVRGRGGVHQAARRRQVRRRLLQRDRRPARRRLLGGQRAVDPAGRRGGPQRRHLGDVVPARRAGRRSTGRDRRPGSPRAAACARSAGPPKGQTGTRVTYWPDRQIFLKDAQLSLKDLAGPGAADQLPGARAGAARDRRRGPASSTERDVPARRRDLGVLRVPGARPLGHRCDPAARPGPVHRDRADAGRRRPHGADRRRPRPRHRHRGALGRRATRPASSRT